MVKYRFTVTGKMPFPTDMLRYDSCYPEDSVSAGMISDSICGTRERGEVYKVNLVAEQRPTNKRWESFMWKVV